MESLWVKGILVLLFILVGGLFAASEIALVSLRESQVAALAERGRAGRAVARLTADSNRFLSAVQVGVTLAGFFSASFGAAQIAPAFTPGLERLGLGGGASVVAFVGTTLVIAYLSLVLGELVPKRLAMQATESTALLLARPLDALATALRPVIWMLSASTDFVVRLLGKDPTAQREEMDAEELRSLVSGHDALSEQERAIVGRLLGVSERSLREVMTPRTEVDFVPGRMPLAEARAFVTEHGRSRYPILGEDRDDIIGFLHARDLLTPPVSARVVRDLARPVGYFPAGISLLAAFSTMQLESNHLVVVLDEYGGTDGIATLEDVLEVFVGQIRDEYDEAEPAVAEFAVGGLLPGLLGRAEAAEVLGQELPDGPFETLGGFAMDRLGRIPVVGDSFEWNGFVLRVEALDGRRVDRIRVTRGPDAAPIEGPAAPAEGGVTGE